jgi:protein phosphatase
VPQLGDTTRRLYGLNLARALGDRFLKDEDLGLSAEPSVSDVVHLPPASGALVLVASDGLWDVVDFARAAALAAATDRERDGSVVAVAHAVVAAAKAAHTRDDVTALVVRVWPEADWERRSPTRGSVDLAGGAGGGSFERQAAGW